MEEEFNKVKLIFTEQIRLSPFNPDRAINIMIDGANSAGVGFVFYQNVNDQKPEEEVTIVNANSRALKPSQMQYSAVDCEVLGLKFATDANSYYLYSAPIINVFTDCIALEGIFNKQLGDIKNKRIRDMVERMMCFNFHDIPGKDNKISDCFSRLTRRIREAEHYDLAEPILADRSVIKRGTEYYT